MTGGPHPTPTVVAVADADAAADAVVRLLLAVLPASGPGGATDRPVPAEQHAPSVGDGVSGPAGTVEGLPGASAGVAGSAGHDTGDAARTTVALTGGRSPIEAFRRLGAQPVDWSSVDVFLADERCVPYDHADSNARAVDEALGKRGYTLHGLPQTGSPGDRARAYAHELGDRPLSVVLLGLGEDGHVASLFPGHGGLDANGATVAILDSPKPPPERVSLTLPRIAGADRIVLLALGGAKADALRRTLEGPSPLAPGSLLPADRLTIVADADALRAARDAGLVPEPR